MQCSRQHTDTVSRRCIFGCSLTLLVSQQHTIDRQALDLKVLRTNATRKKKRILQIVPKGTKPQTMCPQHISLSVFVVLLCWLSHPSFCFFTDEEDFYSFTVEDIHGSTVPLEKYRGKISLVVNVATECGYTDLQYKGLVLLQQTFGHTGKFNVLAFPSNQFGGQEPAKNKDIYQHVLTRYRVNFPMFAKIDVVDKDAHPAWHFLTESSDEPPVWNFFKYLVDHTGQVINVSGPRTEPEDLRQQIQRAILDIGAGNVRKGRDEF